MNSTILNNKDGILNGINITANTVKSTMGKDGKTVMIGSNDNYETLLFTQDGVTVAKSINLEDPVENMGAQLVINAANKTVEECGDGPQPLRAKILTPTGWTTMGEIKKGDTICGSDGSIQSVEEVYDKGEKDIYEVHFTNNRVVECCKNHLWTVVDKDGYKKTIPLSKIIETGVLNTSKKYNDVIYNSYKYYTPKCLADFNDVEVPIPPYLLGVLIGDGSLSGSGDIEISIGFKKKHILDSIHPKYIKSVYEDNVKNYIRIKLTNIVNDLKLTGLYGTISGTKFIPEMYKYNSVSKRSELLEGLLDTDGYINKRGRFEYSTISKKLYEDFLELTRGLGISTNHKLHKKDKNSGSYSDTPIYRITELKGYKYGDKIIQVKWTGKSEQTKCIKVSNSDHLYITDNYIMTHNTTLTATLLQAFINEECDNINDHKEEVETLIKHLEDITIKIKTNEDIKDISTTSSKSEFIGGIFKSIYDETNDFDTYVSLEKSDTPKTHYEISQGINYKTDTGYFHPSFMTDKNTSQCVYENCYVHIDNHPIRQVTPMYQQMLEMAAQNNTPLLILAPRFSDAFFRACSMNKVNQGVPVVLAKIPGFGYSKVTNTEDINQYLTDGYANKVVLTPTELTIYNDKDVSGYVESLKSQLIHSIDKYEESTIHKRIHKLKQTTCTIYAGGNTIQEQNETYLRIEDAIGSVNSALESGYVAGGGSTMFKLSRSEYGEYICKILVTPLNNILENANIKLTDAHVEKIHNGDNLGINTETMEIENMIESGVIDPTKCLISAIKNSYAQAKLYHNSNYAIYNNYKSNII